MYHTLASSVPLSLTNPDKTCMMDWMRFYYFPVIILSIVSFFTPGKHDIPF